MKFLLILISILTFSASAFSYTDRPLTVLAHTDEGFIQKVESEIKNLFVEPETVVLHFHSARAEYTSHPEFGVKYEYFVKVGRVQFGLCSFTYSGKLESDSKLKYNKLEKHDCGE